MAVGPTSHPALGATHAGIQSTDYLGPLSLAVNRHSLVPKFVVRTDQAPSDDRVAGGALGAVRVQVPADLSDKATGRLRLAT